jgi:hypothetical protein
MDLFPFFFRNEIFVDGILHDEQMSFVSLCGHGFIKLFDAVFHHFHFFVKLVDMYTELAELWQEDRP